MKSIFFLQINILFKSYNVKKKICYGLIVILILYYKYKQQRKLPLLVRWVEL